MDEGSHADQHSLAEPWSYVKGPVAANFIE